MLDIKFIKENKDVVLTSCKNKNNTVDIESLLSLYEERRGLKTRIDEINQKRNEAQKNRNIEEGQELKKQLEEVEVLYNEVDKKYFALMLLVPNIPSLDTPVGKDENENKILRKWGEVPVFPFTPKEHFELGADLGILDTETATEVTGPRFSYMKGDLALLHHALNNYVFSILTSKEKLESIIKKANLDVSSKPFIPVVPPVLIKPAVMNRMARLEPKEERYQIPVDELFLIGSAEHVLGPMHMDEVFEEKELPIRYCALSSAFRREAGSHGKDMKGMLRLHQFEKLEMETFCLSEHSYKEQDLLVAIQEYINQELKLPYQVIICCTGDMGDPDHKHIDIETWMPGQQKYRETHSADHMAGFQARRLNTRVKRSDGKIDHVHMNDATAVAGRTLIAILENYQTAEGGVKIPEVLKPFMGGKEYLERPYTFHQS